MKLIQILEGSSLWIVPGTRIRSKESEEVLVFEGNYIHRSESFVWLKNSKGKLLKECHHSFHELYDIAASEDPNANYYHKVVGGSTQKGSRNPRRLP